MTLQEELYHVRTKREAAALCLRGRFRELLTEAGLTQRAFARAMGVNPASVTHWLNGRQTPRKGESAERFVELCREIETALEESA